MFYNLNGIRTEIKQLGNTISKQLINIKNDIPYQSEIEIENKKLLDSNVKLKEQLKQIEGSLISLQEVNEKLLKYIEDNWNKLKEYIKETKLKEFEKSYGKRYGKTFTQAEIIVCNMILDKMQELQGSNSNE